MLCRGLNMRRLVLFMIGWVFLVTVVGTTLVAAEPLTLTSSEDVVSEKVRSFKLPLS